MAEEFTGKREFRVVDTGDSLTVALVTYDPFDEPISVEFTSPEAYNLDILASIVMNALKKPVISKENIR